MAGWRGYPRPARYAVLALAGALPVLAFPAPNLEFVAWFGLVPGLLLMRASATAKQAATAGWWFGGGYLMAALYWLIPNLGPGLLLVVAVLGVLWAGVGVACWALLRAPVTARRALAALVVLPSCWLAGEWIRSWQGFGGPWAVLGVSQWQHPAVLALAAVGGVWLVSFALVAANTGILILIVARSMPARLLGSAGAALAVAAGPVAFALTAAPPVSRYLTVAVVQPGVVHNPSIRVNASERLSAGLRRGHADLIVWGESSVAYDLNTDASLLGRLENLSAADRAPILVNQDSIAPDGAKSKVAVLVGSNGIDGRYVKTRLVPFGEYIPFRQQLGWLAKISKAAPQNMIPGAGAHVIRVPPAGTPPGSTAPGSTAPGSTAPGGTAPGSTAPGGTAPGGTAPGGTAPGGTAPGGTAPGGRPLTIGVLICFESAFPDMSRVDADLGAQAIIYQTSDSTWQAGWEWVLAQHAALGALRAAETGRPVLQAALTGDSAAFDARGRLLAWAGPSYRGVTLVRLPLPPAATRTPYDRLGDYVPWTATGIAALAAAIALIRTGPVRHRRVREHRPARILLERNLRHRSSVRLTSGSSGKASVARSQDPETGADTVPRAGQ
jgi:apolipoprotein N-acyltransferase